MLPWVGRLLSVRLQQPWLTESVSQLTTELIDSRLRCIGERLKNVHEKTPEAKLYACLVDAENTQASRLRSIIDELNRHGEIAIRRIYGDFSRQDLLPWKSVSNELSFRPHTQFAIIPGKGTSDMAMAMDAIEILHGNGLKIDGFALVSSDSDFTPLASKLREEGKHVIGFGCRKTPIPFVNSCRKFVHLENLGSNLAQTGELQNERKAVIDPSSKPVNTKKIKLSAKLKGLDVELRKAYAACLSDPRQQKNGEWIHLPALKTALVRHSPSWDVRNYGVSQSKGLVGLLELPGISEIFEVKIFGRSSARVRSKQ